MKEVFSGWETTRLSKHFILLDFLASQVVYRSGTPLAFDEIWNDEHDELAKGLCNNLLEPLVQDKHFGPISIADAFWPAVFKGGFSPAFGPKHRWADGEATVDIALYRLVDEGKRNNKLKKTVESIEAIDKFRDRVLSYPNTEFLCLTFKPVGAKKCGSHGAGKTQSLRAHHVRVGRYFNLLDFCRNGRAVEEGIDLVPKNAENDGRTYCPVPEETAARSFAPRWTRWWKISVGYRSYAGWRQRGLHLTIIRSCIAGIGTALGGWCSSYRKAWTRSEPARFYQAFRMSEISHHPTTPRNLFPWRW